MNILICNERLRFRFGLDRVLLLLAEGLRKKGHRITLMAQRLDSAVTADVAHRVLEVRNGNTPYIELDARTAQWLQENWSVLFSAKDEPDLAIVGGWPFFGCIPILRNSGVPTVFVDCGAVPLEGYEGHARAVQLKVRELRRTHLPRLSAALAISKFIAETQTRRDAPNLTDMESILLGADHLENPLWRGGDLGLEKQKNGGPVERVRRARAKGRKIILNLGRWEPGSYKRSERVFDLASDLISRNVPDFVIGVLEKAERVSVPAELGGTILPVGFPDDTELAEMINLAEVGVSLSTWEGFNLPVAELQWFGKPAVALNVAAHPEVVCHPWCLARDDVEIADKLETLLTSGFPEPNGFRKSVEWFRERFAWSEVQAKYIAALESSVRCSPPVIIVDVSQACCDTANSGVMRVTRRLCHHLQKSTEAEVVFGVWDASIEAFGLPYDTEYERIGSFSGPETRNLPHSLWGQRIELMGALAERGIRPDWILIPELVREPRARKIRRSARVNDICIAAVFYDAIPVLHPELVADQEVRENHAEYMRGLAECDAVLAISDFSKICLIDFWSADAEVSGAEGVLRTVRLPNEFGGAPRSNESKKLVPGAPVEILCVSTLEPRKNHLALLASVRRLDELAPNLDWRLTLVGNHYSGAETIKLAIEAAASADPRIRWLGVVEDDTLHQLYTDSTLTVYGSWIEGFGMPVVESLWHGTPVLCHDGGVMRELAAEGGCLVADLQDRECFAQALSWLATDAKLYNELSAQAVKRSTRSWDDYARDVLAVLRNTHRCPGRSISRESS